MRSADKPTRWAKLTPGRWSGKRGGGKAGLGETETIMPHHADLIVCAHPHHG
jgi:hypothetical protein